MAKGLFLEYQSSFICFDSRHSVLLERFKFSYFLKHFTQGPFSNYGRKDDSTNTHFKENIPRIFLS